MVEIWMNLLTMMLAMKCVESKLMDCELQSALQVEICKRVKI